MTEVSEQAEPEAAGVLRTWLDTQRPGKAILLGIVVNRLAAFLQLYLVLFLTHQGFSPVQAGFALGVYGVGAVVGVLIGGSLTDKLGARQMIVASMAGSAVFIVAILYLTSYPLLLVAIAAVAAVGQAYRPASSALLAVLTPKSRMTMTFAMYRLAFNVGSMVAPLLGAALLAAGWYLLFWAEALAAVAYAAIAVVALPAAGSRRARQEAAGERTSYLDVVKDRRFVLFLAASMINAAIYVQYISVLPLAMREAGLATGWYGAMVALNAAIVLAFELLITKATQRWPLVLVMALGFLLLGVGRALYALPWGLTVFILGTLIWTLAEIIAGPTMFAYPPLAAPDHLRGRYIAAGNAMFGMGAAIGPIAGLSLWALVGSHTWWIMSLFTLVGLALALAGVRQSVLAKAVRPGAQTGSPIWNRITHRLRRHPRAPEGVS